MIKLSKRLYTIASLVETDNVFDIGCDHGYLSIYLSKNHNVTATDISLKCVEKTINNMKKCNASFKVLQTDGTNNLVIDKNDTLIISGMGSSNIFQILNDNNIPNNLIIQSNNNNYLIRKIIINKHYYIYKEIIVYENNKFYVILYFKKGLKKYSIKDILLGVSNDKEYIEYVKEIYNKAYNSIPLKYILKKLKYKYLIKKIS